MDSQFAFASRDDIWHLQNEVKGVYTMQAEHSERISRLERRQEEDSRLKSVWGTSSPFPSILGGTPQQGKSHDYKCLTPLTG
jgi:ubiquitin carboxyl-terminal hydrolase 4/11/15